jgi:hypothetical protein
MDVFAVDAIDPTFRQFAAQIQTGEIQANWPAASIQLAKITK